MSTFQGLHGQFATFGGGGGAGYAVTLSGNYTLTAGDDGKTFIIDSNAADRTITVPAGLPLGFTFSLWCNSTSKKIIAQFSGSERARHGGSTTSAGGTLSFDGATDTGYSTTLKKVSAGFANTYYGTLATTGSPALT